MIKTILINLSVIVCFTLFIFCNSAIAQPAYDYFDENYKRYHNYVYIPTIKTVLLHVDGFELTPPMLELNGKERLRLSFDDMDTEQRDLWYSIEHCNADWQASALPTNMYIQGQFQDFISDFQYSFNTRTNYIHYSVVFPSDNMKITRSGNYLLKVYENNDPEQLVLTRRFMVYEQKAKITTALRRPVPPSLRETHQEIDFEVDFSALQVVNPQENVKVSVMQNFRWDNAMYQIKPFFVRDRKLIFDYDDGTNCFPAGNEFRFFDVRSIRVQMERVWRIVTDSTPVVIHLMPDAVRSFGNYVTYQESNGAFFVRTTDGGRNHAIDADYVWVNFYLPYESPFIDGNLYVFGALSDWQFKEDFKMFYDYQNKAYRARILLKQGFYNFIYSFLPNSKQKGDDSLMEGDFFQTENDYYIMVYQRALMNNFDELVGFLKVNTVKQ